MKWSLVLFLSAMLTLLYGVFFGENILYASISMILFYLSSKEENWNEIRKRCC